MDLVTVAALLASNAIFWLGWLIVKWRQALIDRCSLLLQRLGYQALENNSQSKLASRLKAFISGKDVPEANVQEDNLFLLYKVFVCYGVYIALCSLFFSAPAIHLLDLVKPHATQDIFFGKSSFQRTGIDCINKLSMPPRVERECLISSGNASSFDDDMRLTMKLDAKMPVWLMTVFSPLSSVTTVALFGSTKLLQADETLDEMAKRVGYVNWKKHAVVLVFIISSIISIRRDASLMVKTFAGMFGMPLRVSFVLSMSSLTKTAWSLLGLRAIYAKSMLPRSRTEAGNVARPRFFSLHVYKEALGKLVRPGKLMWGSNDYRKLMALSQGHLWVLWSQVAVMLYAPLSLLTAIFVAPALVMTLIILYLSGWTGMAIIVPWTSSLLGLHSAMRAYPIFIRWVLEHKQIYLSALFTTMLFTLWFNLGHHAFTSILAIGAVTVLLALACKRLCTGSVKVDQTREPLVKSANKEVAMQHLASEEMSMSEWKLGGTASILFLCAIPSALTWRCICRKSIPLTTLFLNILPIIIMISIMIFGRHFFPWSTVPLPPSYVLTAFLDLLFYAFILFFDAVLPAMCFAGHFFDARLAGALAEELLWSDADPWHKLSTPYPLYSFLAALRPGTLREDLVPEDILFSTHDSRARLKRRLERYAKYDSAWVEVTGAEEPDWQENFIFSVAIPLLFPIVIIPLLRVYAGDGLLGSFWETHEDRNLSNYLMALNTETHEAGVIAASALHNTNLTAFDRIATWAESFNLFT